MVAGWPVDLTVAITPHLPHRRPDDLGGFVFFAVSFGSFSSFQRGFACVEDTCPLQPALFLIRFPVTADPPQGGPSA
jgi:hypothetical protein